MVRPTSGTAEPARPIGSDFPSLPSYLLRDLGGATPWKQRGPVMLVETGRQALARLATTLGAAGRHAIAIPAFACESMITPFSHRGWSVTAFGVDDELRPDLAQVTELTQAGTVDTVLAIRYFGAIPDNRDRAAVAQLRRKGAFVIADETHHPFHPFAWDASAAFASLRKVLPVADGAYLHAGKFSVAGALGAPSEHRRWEAMDAVDAASGADGPTRRALDTANAVLDSDDQPRAAGARTAAVLAQLPYGAIAARRVSNAKALLDALAGADLLVPLTDLQTTPVPSHVVIRTVDPRGLQQRLAQQRIYCPIHWPQPEAFARDFVWPVDLLSIPIDHRYDSNDMRRVGETIRREIRR